jgi:hypothetical protein
LPFTEFYRRKDENRICGTTKRKGNLSSALEKADSQWKYIFERRHSSTKTIFEDREKKLQYFFTFTTKKMALAIGHQWSILKSKKPPTKLI